MTPDLWPEINDAVRTGIEGLQVLSTWRRNNLDEHEDEAIDDALVIPGASTAVPRESGPQVVYGRGDVIRDFARKAEEDSPRLPQLLYGAGGMGKSTIARLAAGRFGDSEKRHRVWWVSAADEDRLSAGLISVARDLGASTADQAAIGSHVVADLGAVIDRVWRLLDCGSRRWMLVIDDADDPRLLGPADGTGWVRRTRNGLLLVTTRTMDEAAWPEADFIQVDVLPTTAAADVLTGLAPEAGDRAAAVSLAERLGCLPLALRMAGMYLRQDFVSWRTFDDYRRAFDREGAALVVDASERPDCGLVVTRTWELSLDALAAQGLPQARLLLWMLSCYAPGSPIPESLVTAAAVTSCDQGPSSLMELLGCEKHVQGHQRAEFCRSILRSLRNVSLIQRSGTSDRRVAVELHPFIAEITRAAMDASDPEQMGIDPRTVRQCAVETLTSAIDCLDAGEAKHWPYFRALTPHVIELLTTSAPQLDRPVRAGLLNCVVRCIASYMWSRAESRAQQLAEDALRIAADLGAECEPVYQRLRHVYACSLREQGALAEAEAVFHGILAAQLRLPDGEIRRDTLRTRHDLAWTIGRQGRWADAETQFRDVLQLRTQRYHQHGSQREYPDILHTRCMLCWSIGKQGRWTEAESLYRQLAADRAQTIGLRHPDTLDTWENIGKALAWQGNWTAAQRQWEELVRLRAQELGEKHPDTLRTRQLASYAAGLLARENGNRVRRREAVKDLKEILDTQVDIRGEDHKETRETRALLADLERKPQPEPLWPEDLPQPVTRPMT